MITDELREQILNRMKLSESIACDSDKTLRKAILQKYELICRGILDSSQAEEIDSHIASLKVICNKTVFLSIIPLINYAEIETNYPYFDRLYRRLKGSCGNIPESGVMNELHNRMALRIGGTVRNITREVLEKAIDTFDVTDITSKIGESEISTIFKSDTDKMERQFDGIFDEIQDDTSSLVDSLFGDIEEISENAGNSSDDESSVENGTVDFVEQPIEVGGSDIFDDYDENVSNSTEYIEGFDEEESSDTEDESGTNDDETSFNTDDSDDRPEQNEDSSDETDEYTTSIEDMLVDVPISHSEDESEQSSEGETEQASEDTDDTTDAETSETDEYDSNDEDNSDDSDDSEFEDNDDISIDLDELEADIEAVSSRLDGISQDTDFEQFLNEMEKGQAKDELDDFDFSDDDEELYESDQLSFEDNKDTTDEPIEGFDGAEDAEENKRNLIEYYTSRLLPTSAFDNNRTSLMTIATNSEMEIDTSEVFHAYYDKLLKQRLELCAFDFRTDKGLKTAAVVLSNAVFLSFNDICDINEIINNYTQKMIRVLEADIKYAVAIGMIEQYLKGELEYDEVPMNQELNGYVRAGLNIAYKQVYLDRYKIADGEYYTADEINSIDENENFGKTGSTGNYDNIPDEEPILETDKYSFSLSANNEVTLKPRATQTVRKLSDGTYSMPIITVADKLFKKRDRLFESTNGTTLAFTERWKLVMAAIKKMVDFNVEEVQKVAILDRCITINGKLLILDNLLGWEHDIELVDFLDIKMLLSEFYNIKHLVICENLFESVFCTYGLPGNTLYNIFLDNSALCTIGIILSGMDKPLTFSKQTIGRRLESVEDTLRLVELRLRIERFCAEQNPRFEVKSPGYQLRFINEASLFVVNPTSDDVKLTQQAGAGTSSIKVNGIVDGVHSLISRFKR